MILTQYVIDKTINLTRKEVYECTEDAVPEAITQKCVLEVYVDDELVLVRPPTKIKKTGLPLRGVLPKRSKFKTQDYMPR